MKIKIKRIPYAEAISLPRPKHKRPLYPSRLLRGIVRLASIPSLLGTRFSYTEERMEEAGKGPYLILMNHSCFLDMKIASAIFFPKPYNVVCTTDAMIGLNWLMRWLGAIPTQKYVSDLSLVRDIMFALHEKKSSVLMYPEAGYSFDGRPRPLPRRLGVLLKKLKVPVVTVITEGAFLRDPLYNGLQLRKVKVSARVKCLLTPEEIESLPVEEIDRLLEEAFTFDAFAWQQKNNVKIDVPFRADGLHRILYQCPHCGKEGETEGKGTTLTCHACGAVYELTEYGKLNGINVETRFDHIPHWMDWQREQVRISIEKGEYSPEIPVEIGLMKDAKALYMVGDGVLKHSSEGFSLEGCGGELKYSQPALSSYTLNADFFWYEIGDVIGIGDRECLYYCFPKDTRVPVTKVRLATEEIYRMEKDKKK